MLFIRSAFVKSFPKMSKTTRPSALARTDSDSFCQTLFKKLFTHNMPLYATEQYNQNLNIRSYWDLYSYLIFAVVVILQLSNWHKLPLFLDCYYHLSVMRGFADAGGWVGVSFWDYAPFGRPHLYPPLFHILELIVFKCGASPILVAKIFDLSIYPLFLLCLWFVIRSIYSKETAFFSLLLSISSYPLYLSIVNNIPFTIAFIFGFLSFYFIKKQKILSAVLALALSLYTHSLMSSLMALSLMFYGFFLSDDRKTCLWVIFWAILAASPLIFHQLKYMAFIHPLRMMEFYYAQINPFFYILAVFGLVLALKKRGEHLFFVALSIVMLGLLFTNRDRFFSGHGLIPIIFLAALFLEHFWKKISVKQNRRGLFFFWATVIFVFFVLTPIVIISPLKKYPVFLCSSWIVPASDSTGGIYAEKGGTFYYPRLIDEAVRIVEQNSSQDDILFSNYNYGGGIISALAHRATSGAMLLEVLPFRDLGTVKAARFVLWFKDPGGIFPPGLSDAIGHFFLKKVAETELVYLYVNEGSTFKKKVVRARVPFGVCVLILAGILFVIVFDCKNRFLKKK